MAKQAFIGKVVGIGKLKVPRTLDFNHEIPMLSFLVTEKPDGGYTATCIHFLVDGYGNEIENAINDMIDAVESFLVSNFDHLSIGDAWYNLKDLAHSDEYSSSLWNAYRDFQFDLAADGKSMDTVEALKKRIQQLNKRIEQLEEENEKLKERLAYAKEDIIIDFVTRKEALAS